MLPYIDRPIFFENQVLGDQDLDAIVAYARDRDRRHSLGPHTWGVVFGLSLLDQEEPDGTIACLLTPGIAVDGYGRLIVVERPLRIAEALLSNLIDPLVPLWIGYEETAVEDTRSVANACCSDTDAFRRMREGFRLTAGRLTSVQDRHDGIVVGDDEIEDPRTFGALTDPAAPLLCDASIPIQSMADRSPVPRWWVPLGHAGWTPGAPGSFRMLSDAERIVGRMLRRYAGLVTEDVLAADGMIRLRRRETVRPLGASVDDACAADLLNSSDFAVADGKATPVDLISLEGDARALGQVKLFGTRLEFRKETGEDGGVPLYMRRASAGGGESLDIVLGETATADNRLAIGIATDFGDIVAQVVVKADGRVGIGTENPEDYADDANRLVIAADEATGLTIATPSAAAGAVNFADGTAANEAAQGFIRYDHARDVMLFGTDNEVAVAIDHNGRVGIGTETPATGLHVMNGQDANLSNNSGYVVVGDVAAANIVIDNNEMMARNAGATSPLHFQANGGDLLVHQNVATATRFAVTDAGRVGIGTFTPETVLHIKGDDPDIKLDMNGTSPNALCEIRFAQDGAVGSSIYWNRSDGRTYLQNAGATAVTIQGASLGVGLGAVTPQARLHVRDTKNGDADFLDSYVALIENVSTGDSADVLALRIATPTAGSGNNFVTFFDGGGACGSIEGNGIGVTLNTSSADFAEALVRLDPGEKIAPGDVVGLHGGSVSHTTRGADAVLVATTRPAVLGNVSYGDPSRVGVTLVGQSPVRVRGPVKPGDLLRASGANDGVAVAVTPETVTPEQISQLIGRAWTAHASAADGMVTAAVGIGPDTVAISYAWSADRARLQQLERDVAELKRLVAEISRSTEPRGHGGA